VAEDTALTIERLKAKLAASTDAELARFLGVDKSTIASWKARGKVPQRYSCLLEDVPDEDKAEPPALWGNLENAAFKIALFRFCLTQSEFVNRGDPRTLAGSIEVWDTTFWLSVKRAKEDILAVLKHGLSSIETATTLLLTEDLSDRTAAIHRTCTFLRAGPKRSMEKLGAGFSEKVDQVMPPEKLP